MPDDAMEFLGESGLLRRVHPQQVILDQNSGGYRPSSAAFNDDNLSVDIETILALHHLDWNFTQKGYEGFFSTVLGRSCTELVAL
jgi:hypothetical protein